MEIDLFTVRRIFEDLLSRRISREQADRWAYSIIQHEESGTLTYRPLSDRPRIWAGVMYLYGIDAMDAPGVYLHTDLDISAAMTAKLGNT